MIKLVLDDTLIQPHLYPFTYTRSAADIRIGILTIREKWEKLLGQKVTVNGDDYLQHAASEQENIPAVFAANIIPSTDFIKALLKGNYSEQDFLEQTTVRILQHPWQIFQYNDWAIREDFKLVTAGRHSTPIPESVQVMSARNIFIEEGAKLEHCILNAGTGPIYIGKNTEIMEGSIIRGPFALCEGATVKMGAKIYGATTIGPNSIVGGEIKNSVIFGYSNKAHEGYLGDSVIGEWCNLGAGTSNSNIKNTASEVKVWDYATNSFSSAGLKCGLIMGDYSRCAINTSFNTGTVVGLCCNVFGQGLTPRYIPNFTWGNEKYEFEKALKDIINWKQLKNQLLTEKEIQRLQHTFESTIETV
jgi:UDP-N-acetylglucosamine diphosphorylase / glucose-1-phosphate thymidylyltransferase / UDP-N-acetylgalactosamine diphosphorylase / glucosamine-1-phosphate N-acetyltransferase / galactosamine-1-phosphate N-acetyltransferase